MASENSIGKSKGAQGGDYLNMNTLHGMDSCQTIAAHNCAAAVPPVDNISNLEQRKTTNLGLGETLTQKARHRNCGTPRGILDNRPGGEQN